MWTPRSRSSTAPRLHIVPGEKASSPRMNSVREALLVAAGMDDQDVATRATRDVLADAAAEQPLEKAWFAGAHDDQLGLLVLGSVEKLLRGLPRYASEFDLEANVGEQRVHPLAMLFPQLLVSLDSLASADRVGAVRHQAECPR